MTKIIDARLSVPAPRLRSFAALMELYEANYLLLRRLVPAMKTFEGLQVLEGRNGLPLHIDVIGQEKFTTVLRIFYLLRGEGDHFKEAPDIHVRIYHDASVAEAVAGRLRGRDCVTMGRSGERCLDVRWQLNRFLYKCLRFLCTDTTNLYRSELL